MPKLKSIEREQLKQEIKENQIPREELIKKYQLSARQVRRYFSEVLGEARYTGGGRPPAQFEILKMEDEPMGEEIKKEELLPKEDSGADPDLCGECHVRGVKTILERSYVVCPRCGVELDWAQ